MLFGDKNEFAIEAVTSSKMSAVVRACLWVGGERVGNMNTPMILPVFVWGLSDLAGLRDGRGNEKLWNRPAREILVGYLEALYVDTGQTDEQIAEDTLFYRKHRALPVGEAFDGWRALMVGHDRDVRYVWADTSKYFDQGLIDVKERRFSYGLIESVMERAIDELGKKL